MIVNPRNVVDLLAQRFASIASTRMTSDDIRMADELTNLLENCRTGVSVDAEEFLDTDASPFVEQDSDDEDDKKPDSEFDEYDWDSDEDDNACSPRVSKEEMESTLQYYRGTAKGFRTFSSMTSRFRWIRNLYDLKRLRK